MKKVFKFEDYRAAYFADSNNQYPLEYITFMHLFSHNHDEYIKGEYTYKGVPIKWTLEVKSATSKPSNGFVTIHLLETKTHLQENYQSDMWDKGLLLTAPFGSVYSSGTKKLFISLQDLKEAQGSSVKIPIFSDKRGKTNILFYAGLQNARSLSVDNFADWSAIQMIRKTNNKMVVSLSISKERPDFNDALIEFDFSEANASFELE